MYPRFRSSSRFGFNVHPALVLGLIVLLGLSACRSVSDTTPYRTLGWEKHRLPNAARPYDKLLVEIDAVAGSEPRPGELADLKTLLEQFTNKPGGVTVKLDNLISPAKARGRGPDALALEYLNGPADDQTAFIYVLCYRGRLSPFVNPENPHFTHFPFPSAIFINRSYAFGWFSWLTRARQLMMQHEMGHALGLVDRESHSHRGHCTNRGCLMRSGIRFSFGRLLTFRPPFDNTEFCADCRQDLENYQRSDAPPGARFWRGYFVRSGDGYHLLTLPGIVYVHFGDLEQVDMGRVGALRREAIGSVAVRGDLKYEAYGDLSENAVGLRRFVEHETEEKGLRKLAENVLTSCLAQAEAARDSDPKTALEITRVALDAAALKFPELHAKLKALQDSLAESAVAKPTQHRAGDDQHRSLQDSSDR